MRSFLLKAATCAAVVAMTSAALNAAVTPISHYRLGEDDPGAAPGAQGNLTTVDSAGANDLTRGGTAPLYSSDVTPAAGQNGGSTLAMDFTEGVYSGPVVTAPGGSPITNNFGIEAFFEFDELHPRDMMIAYNGNSGGNGFGLLWHNAAKQVRGIFGGRAFVSGEAITKGTRYHLALVREEAPTLLDPNAGTTTLYVNGEKKGDSTGTAPAPASGQMQIGAGQPTAGGDIGAFTDGRIDEVRIFTFAPGQFSTDDLLFNVVPEPSSLGLLAVGLVALLRRRRSV